MESTYSYQAGDMLPGTERPQFLSALCILTWICSGLLFLSTLYNTFNMPTAEQKAEQVENMRGLSEKAALQLEKTYENMDDTTMLISNLISLVCLVLSSIGAMMMWQLKRTGFYLYIAGEVLPYLGFLFAGTAAYDGLASATGMSAAAALAAVILVMVVFDGLFIGLYAANLKHMTNTSSSPQVS